MNTDNNITSSSPLTAGSILITGGSGLVGSHLIKTLVQQSKKVRALYRSTIPEFDGSNLVEWVLGDILDIISLETAMENVEQVYHCAAIVSFNKSDKQQMFKVNVDGTTKVVNACLNGNVKKLCYVSSVASLGTGSEGIEMNETMSWTEKTSNSNYGKSKYLAEMEVWRGIGEGLNAVIVNPSIILGAGDWSKGSSGIFKTVYDEFPWYTEGVKGFVGVRDVVHAMIALMESNTSGERFILSAENRKFKDVFTAIAYSFGKKPPYKKVNRFMAGVVWRFSALKAFFTGGRSMLTRETAEAAQSIVYYNNTKITKFLPSFTYTPLEQTITGVCQELKKKNNLK